MRERRNRKRRGKSFPNLNHDFNNNNKSNNNSNTNNSSAAAINTNYCVVCIQKEQEDIIIVKKEGEEDVDHTDNDTKNKDNGNESNNNSTRTNNGNDYKNNGKTIAKYKCPKCRAPYCSVACCKLHREICSKGIVNGAAASTANTSAVNHRTSKYLPSDALTEDPVRNALHRRSMLQDGQELQDDEDVEEGWRITREMMDKLDNSTWLKNELKDGGLRQMIASIDCDNDYDEIHQHKNNKFIKKRRFQAMNERPMEKREIQLEQCKRTNPNFATFIDKLLLTAGVVHFLNDHHDYDNNEQSAKYDCSNRNMEKIVSLLEGKDAVETKYLHARLMLAPIQNKKKHVSLSDIQKELTDDDDDDGSNNATTSDDDSSDSDKED